MTTDAPAQAELLLDGPDRPPAGSPARFAGRWRLTAAGLCDVWHYGDLVLDAPSGRLLMRGANGTGKTTALEALCPYLLDLNASKLAAGKSRPTTLSLLMREGSEGKRRTGYAWLTFAAPITDRGDADTLDPDVLAAGQRRARERSWGVRLQYSPKATPQVRVVPFTAPGRPLEDLRLYGPDREALSAEEFTAAVEAAGGHVFDDQDEYVDDLAANLWDAAGEQVTKLTERLRQVRNPTLLAEISPDRAADALRASLPGVDPAVIAATAEALSASDETREAFDRDRAAASLLADFATTWDGHVTDVLAAAHDEAAEQAGKVKSARREVDRLTRQAETAEQAAADADRDLESAREQLEEARAEVTALMDSPQFKSAEELQELTNTHRAQTQNAAARLAALTKAAGDRASAGQAVRGQLTDLVADLDDQVTAAVNADAAATPSTVMLTFSDKPRATFTIADTTANPGPGLTLTGSPQAVLDTAQQWSHIADRHTQTADAADLAVGDHRRTVKVAGDAAQQATSKAADLATASEAAAQHELKCADTARRHANALLDQLKLWTTAHPDLTAPTGPDHTDGEEPSLDGWTPEQVDELRDAEPGQVVATAGDWSNAVTRRAAHLAATASSEAKTLREQAAALTAEATRLHAEAKQLRDGRLLPLPRPTWAGDGDDTRALGASLTWAEGFNDPAARANVEVALADAGLLGAALTPAGAATSAWSVAVTGDPVGTNLRQVLTVDRAHPNADIAEAVLGRVALVDHAAAAAPTAALVIGRDGSFRSGPLVGDRLTGPGGQRRPAPQASYVGAAQRRAAALARATELDTEAAELTRQASDLGRQAAAAKARARQVKDAADSFPPLTTLQRAEGNRALAAENADKARRQAGQADAAARTARAAYEQARSAWAERVRGMGLSPDVDVLNQQAETSRGAATALTGCAVALRGKLAGRVSRAVAAVEADEELVAALADLHGAARSAYDQARATGARLRVLQESVGADSEEVLSQLARTNEEVDDLSKRLPSLQSTARDTVEKASSLRALVGAAQVRVSELTPEAAQAARVVRELLAAPGVLTVLTGTGPEPSGDGEATGEPEPVALDDDAMLTRAADLVRDRKRVGRKGLSDKYDYTRARLVGLWTLDHGESIHGLDTFVLTHNDGTYTPGTAAARAEELARRAEQALHAADEAALRRFIVGQLPTAIGIAWTALHDWKRSVNRKMKDASASSGVGVQVDIAPARDMSATARIVYELSCKVSAADRTEQQAAQVGEAIRALIDAADGESMVEKVAAAVDVRDWVDVAYVVTRPGKEPAKWTPKTGLSGGERRLVVLAPMLAAVAAMYDSMDEHGLRLVALDEVPAEVDEAGREGLARYIAELDLDLVCTSYLWDGAPGAWDGIDAWDFEGDGTGTVVAFPMLVRGLDGLPGDEEYNLLVTAGDGDG